MQVERRGVRVGEVPEPDDLEVLARPPRGPPPSGRADAAEHDRHRDVVPHRHRRERPRDLVGAGDARRGRSGAAAGRRCPARRSRMRAARRPQRAGQQVDQRRLAGAVRPDQADELALVDREADVLQRVHAAEVAGHVAHSTRRRPAGRSRAAAGGGPRRRAPGPRRSPAPLGRAPGSSAASPTAWLRSGAWAPAVRRRVRPGGPAPRRPDGDHGRGAACRRGASRAARPGTRRQSAAVVTTSGDAARRRGRARSRAYRPSGATTTRTTRTRRARSGCQSPSPDAVRRSWSSTIEHRADHRAEPVGASTQHAHHDDEQRDGQAEDALHRDEPDLQREHAAADAADDRAGDDAPASCTGTSPRRGPRRRPRRRGSAASAQPNRECCIANATATARGRRRRRLTQVQEVLEQPDAGREVAAPAR